MLYGHIIYRPERLLRTSNIVCTPCHDGQWGSAAIDRRSPDSLPHWISILSRPTRFRPEKRLEYQKGILCQGSELFTFGIIISCGATDCGYWCLPRQLGSQSRSDFDREDGPPLATPLQCPALNIDDTSSDPRLCLLDFLGRSDFPPRITRYSLLG